MQLAMEEIYNEDGQVSPLVSNVISGHKACLELINGIVLTAQEISCTTDVKFYESARKGVYFSLLSNQKINTSADFTLLQASLVEEEFNGSFTIKAGETKSLLQLQIQPQQLAQILNESEDTLLDHLNLLIKKLATNENIISMPVIQQTANFSASLLNIIPEKRLSLVGQAYAFSCSVLEQMQILSHMLSCGDCQSKLFNVQNLLEADLGVTKDLTELAYQAGLNRDALELGFYHLVGQTMTEYRNHVQLNKVAAMLRAEHYSRSEIVEQTSFSEDQLEILFIQHFGVPIAQYGQMH